MKTQTDSSVLCIIIYLLIFLLINSALLYHISIKMITKIQKKKKGKKENRVQFYLKLLTTGWKWSRKLSLTEKKKLSHLWSIVEKLRNNDHETSLTIIVLRGPFKRKCGSEDVKSNFSPVLAQTEWWNSEWHCLIYLGCLCKSGVWWRVGLSMGIWFPPTTILLTIFVFLFDCIC